MNRGKKRLAALILLATFIFSQPFGNGIKLKAEGVSQKNNNKSMSSNVNRAYSDKYAAQKFKEKYGVDKQINDNVVYKSNNPDELVRVIVEVNGTSYSEGKAKGKVASNIAANDMISGIEAVKTSQNKVKAQATKLQGAKIRQSYGYLLNGFSMTIKRGEINKLKAIPGVKSVSEAQVYMPDMEYAKSITQAYDVWNNEKLKGEKMVVAIIDTGIDYTHKDMKLTDSSNVKITDINPVGKGKYFTAKVPYGYNFADENQNIIDKSGSMHGMHVAGIVGANGSEVDAKALKAVQGVSPECQLLAMKVFSNDPNNQGAYTDDIVAAIEDSVIHKADVINMSLGSTAAFQDTDDPEQKAISNAVSQGVMVVVSAGNSYYSTYPYKFNGVVDTGLVGAPGLAHDALQVASLENTNVTGIGLDYTSSQGNSSTPLVYSTSEVDPVGVLTNSDGYQVVDCGLGNPEDFTGKDLNGKIALIQRGVITFADKKLNAQNAGAVGVIIYDNKAEGLVNMQADPRIKIPSVFISMDAGNKLANIVVNNLKVQFKGNVGSISNPSSMSMSDFTSYGPTPNLDFKPDITAPGGNIYSTVNSDKYELMSGTSMAAPHTSGAEALIMQSLKNRINFSTGKEMVDFAKATTINAAVPQMDKADPSVPYSPRRQGAGLLQIDNVINNNVTITDDKGNADVALKQIGKSTTYTLKIKNYSNSAIKYNLDTLGGALTESQPKGYTTTFPTDIKIKGSSVSFDKNAVTVPAKSGDNPGEASVSVTISLPDSLASEQFVEGYVRFTPEGNSPALVSPFMGFYGDWSKPAIIDAPTWDASTWFYTTTAVTDLTKVVDGANITYYFNYLGADPSGNFGPTEDSSTIAISPQLGPDGKHDGKHDVIVPYIYLLRNAKTISIDILDKNQKVIRNISLDGDYSKGIYESDSGNGRILENALWDGTVYNSTNGSYDIVDEGQYFMRINTVIDYNGASPQSLIVPVKVDKTAPVVNIISQKRVSDTSYNLKFSVTDNLSGVAPGIPDIKINGSAVDPNSVTIDNDGNFNCTLKLNNGLNKVEIQAMDNAANTNTVQPQYVRVTKDNFSLTFDKLISGMDILAKDTVNGTYTVTGKVNYTDLKTLQIGGVDASIDKSSGDFTVGVKLTDGKNRIKVYALDATGEELANYEIPVTFDSQGPLLQLISPVVQKDGKIHTTDNSVTLKGTITDNSPFRFYVNGNQVLYNDTSKSNSSDFSVNVAVKNGDTIELKVKDDSVNSNILVQTYTVVVDAGYTRIAGKDRYETSALIADAGWKTSQYAVLATGEDYPDALSAAPLAKKYNAPILLTDPKSLNDVTKTEIQKLKVQKVFIIGGTGAVTTNVENTLKQLGITTERISGVNRYDTAVAIAKYMGSANQVVIATGDNFPDALSIASYSAFKQIPILLVEKDSIPTSVQQYIDSNKIQKSYICGGTGVISASVEQKLASPIRLSGANRYDTNVQVVTALNSEFNYDNLYFATGEDYPDALTGSVLAAASKSPIILVSPNMTDNTINMVKTLSPKAQEKYILGGEGAVSNDVINMLEK